MMNYNKTYIVEKEAPIKQHIYNFYLLHHPHLLPPPNMMDAM